MQSTISSRGRHMLLLTNPCKRRLGENVTNIKVPYHHYHCHHRPLQFSKRESTTTTLWVRHFSEGSTGVSSPSTLHHHHRQQHRHRSSFYSFFDWYSKNLDTHPILTKCVSAGLISSLGNVLAQGITHRQQQQQQQQACDNDNDNGNGNGNDNTNDNANTPIHQHNQPFEVNLAQVARFALLNVAFVAPILHHWYQFINRAVPGLSFSRVLQRTFWDEFAFSPMYVTAFLGMLWKLEGATNENIWKMIKSECPSIIVAEWIMWVPTMIVTFRHVPVKFQVLAINVVGVVWQTFLAYAASNAHSSSSTSKTVDDDDDKEQIEEKVLHPTTTTVQGDDNSNNNINNDKENKEISTVGVIIEEKGPLVLNTIVRQHTPTP